MWGGQFEFRFVNRSGRAELFGNSFSKASYQSIFIKHNHRYSPPQMIDKKHRSSHWWVFIVRSDNIFIGLLLLVPPTCAFVQRLVFEERFETMSAIKFGSHLRELRLHLCQSSASSKGVRFVLWIVLENTCVWRRYSLVITVRRQFIEKYYVPLKKANPQFPILLRECSGIEPKVFARYGTYIICRQRVKIFTLLYDEGLTKGRPCR